jgi:LPXTG-motif cell wall-anchored protein
MRYTKRWLAGTAGLSLGLVMGMAPAAHADPITDLTSSLTQAVTGAADMAGTSAEQQGGAATATRKLHGEAPRGNTSSGTLDAGNSNGLNLGGIGATVPITVCGNAVNVIGLDAEASCEGENGDHGAEAGGNSAEGVLDAGDSNGLNIGGVGVTAPITVCGNSVNVIGMGARSHCEETDEEDTPPPSGCGDSYPPPDCTQPPPGCGDSYPPPGCTSPPPTCTGHHHPAGCTPPPCTGHHHPTGCTPPPPPGCTGAGCTPPPPPGCTGAGCTPPPPPGCGGHHPPAGCTPPPPGEHHGHHHGEEAGTLPVTGLDTTGIALGGLALVGLGSGALVAARRRREV